MQFHEPSRWSEEILVKIKRFWKDLETKYYIDSKYYSFYLYFLLKLSTKNYEFQKNL